MHCLCRAGMVFLLWIAWPLMIPGAEFYVAQDGDDANPGTRERPFATLTQARDAVRKVKDRIAPEGVTVFVRGGVYRLADTLVFTLDDSPGSGQTITYAACPGETPVLSGGVPVPKWEKAADSDRLPAAARGKVWMADVSFVRELKERQSRGATLAAPIDCDWRFFTLYSGDRRLPRARGRGFSPARSFPRGAGDHHTVDFPAGAMRNWPGLQDAELVIIPCYYWVSNILPLESVDESSRIARTTVSATYPMGKNGMADRETAWVENVLEVLDEPGEWVLDVEKARLYLRPEGERPADDIVIPVLTQLVRVEGRIDNEGPRDTPVTNLAFRGLTFTHADRFPWHGRTGWGLQHDWERFDSPSAMLRLRGAEGCAIEDCHFVNAGSSGIRLDLHCQRNRIVGNHLEQLGGVGILLAGYGPGTKDVNRQNEAANNHVHHIGQLYWGSPAIFAWQSGENRIAHNHIHHTPYTGICVTGRITWDPKGQGECSRTVRWKELGIDPQGPVPRLPWQQREPLLHSRGNLIERNEIHDAMEVAGDGNCIYVSGAGGGNVVRENYCHDCSGPYMNAVIRCDDDQHGTRIERNLLHRTRGFGEGIISKGNNDILENIIADLRPHDRHRGYLVFPYGSPAGSRIERNVLYSCQAGQTVCFEGKARGAEQAPRLRDTKADYNLCFSTADPGWGDRHLDKQRPFGIEQHSVSANPLFADLAKGDFRFQPGSPALELGIGQPISIDQAGLEPPYQERLLGKRLRTTIRPDGGLLGEPREVSMEVEPAGAPVHYTLDGSDPTGSSPRYAGPFVLREPKVVRANAFAPGSTDPSGARADFFGPPEPLVEDFESARPGALTPRAETQEEDAQHTARISDEQGASGRQSLKFIDGPGQARPSSPHVYYRTRFYSGEVIGRFDLRIDRDVSFSHEWRDYDGTYRRGPSIQVVEGGKVMVAGKTLTQIPAETWVRFEIRCTLGGDFGRKFDLRTLVPGETQPRVFTGLPVDPQFEKLDWIGWIASGNKEAVFYVDNVEVRIAADRRE